jgi:DNA polymerase III subunit beta
MKIEILKDSLEKSVNTASRVANKNLSLPVLGCVVITASKDRVTLKATNLDVSAEIAVPAKVLEEGVVAIPAHILSQTMSTATDEKLTLTLSETTLNVEGSHGSAQIKTVDASDFPTLPFVKEGEGYSVSLPAKELARAFKMVTFSASTSGIRPELSSIYFEIIDGILITAATDSFRLAEMKIPVKTKTNIDPILIPHRNVADIVRAISDTETVEMRIGEGQVSFLVDGSYLTSRLIDGVFPEYQAIIPKNFTTHATVLTQDALKGFRKVSIFADATNQVTLTTKDKKISIEARNTSVGETKEHIDSVTEGDDISISFNIRYIIDALGVMTSDSVIFSIGGVGKPMVISDVPDKGFTYLVMPMNT